MVLAMHMPNAVFLLLAHFQPSSVALVSTALALEQFGYGLGFTAYLMVLIYVADGPADDGRPRGQHQTAHYAICTGFMALGMMLPGLWAGWLQTQLGYADFFIWCSVATLPSFAAAALLRITPAFGLESDRVTASG